MADPNDIDRVWDISKAQRRDADDAVFRGLAGAAGGCAPRPRGRLDLFCHRRARPQGRRDRGPARRLLRRHAPNDNVYLSITGRASVTRDPAKAAANLEEDSTTCGGGRPDDPNARVLEIEPSTAELWDGPASSLVAAFEFAKARITGEKPNLGENRKKTVAMG